MRVTRTPIALGDELTFHDQLSTKGRQVGDDLGSCVIVSITPEVPGPAPKDLALTGGTGTYRNLGGEGNLVEFGNGKGSLTLHVLSFAPRGEGA
jgi:hypothetical protein